MPSFVSQVIRKIMVTFQFNRILEKSLETGDFHTKYVDPDRYLGIHSSLEVHSIQRESVYVIRNLKSKDNRWMFYLHGGAFVHGLSSMQWRMIRNIMKKTGWHVVVPDYPLLPDANHESISQMIDEAYSFMMRNVNPDRIVYLGDSAGGGLALSLAMRNRDKGLRMPDRIMMISPWLDLSMQDLENSGMDRKDPILCSKSLKDIGLLLSKGRDVKDPALSPLYGHLKGLPPMDVWVGTDEILYDDAVRLNEYSNKEGALCTLYVYPDMLHTFVLFGIPESKKAMDEMSLVIMQNK